MLEIEFVGYSLQVAVSLWIKLVFSHMTESMFVDVNSFLTTTITKSDYLRADRPATLYIGWF